MNSFKRSALWQRVFRTRAEDTLPHTIAHQRIYIVPSKRGLSFLLTLLLMLTASINYSLSLGYAICFLLSGLFAATLLHTYRNVAGIGILAVHVEDTFAGNAAAFSVALKNPHKRPRHGIRVASRDGISTRVRINGEEQISAILAKPTESRGICTLGRLTLQSDWPLGLWTCWSYLHVPHQALIFPHPEADAPPLPVIATFSDGAHSQTALQGDVSGLRTYQPGDSLGSIAWKSAARGLGLQTRTFDDEAGPTQTLFDLDRTQVAGLEARLSRICAWILQAEQQRCEYALKLPGRYLDKGCGEEQRQQALATLALYNNSRNMAAGTEVA